MTVLPAPAGCSSPETMYLRRFGIQRFRSCLEVEVQLRPTLTLLVGENNAGKSNIIEALRLATLPLSGRRTRYFEADDLTRGEAGPVELTAEFAGLSPYQRGQYIGALDIVSGTAFLRDALLPEGRQSPSRPP